MVYSGPAYNTMPVQIFTYYRMGLWASVNQSYLEYIQSCAWFYYIPIAHAVRVSQSLKRYSIVGLLKRQIVVNS